MVEILDNTTNDIHWTEKFREMVRTLIREEMAGQMSFPQSGVDIDASGMRISLLIAPGVTLTQNLGEDLMNQVTQKWLETRREIRQHLRVVQDGKQPRKE